MGLHWGYTAAEDRRPDPNPPSSTDVERVEHRLQVGGVAHAVVLVAVVHERVHLLRLAGQRLDPRRPFPQLIEVVEVPEPLGGRRAGLLPRLVRPAVETDHRQLWGGRGNDYR